LYAAIAARKNVGSTHDTRRNRAWRVMPAPAPGVEPASAAIDADRIGVRWPRDDIRRRSIPRRRIGELAIENQIELARHAGRRSSAPPRRGVAFLTPSAREVRRAVREPINTPCSSTVENLNTNPLRHSGTPGRVTRRAR
jgi:hypothetical protein